jgi:protocatechuate 3,4-dioxygenase beta subunit
MLVKRAVVLALLVISAIWMCAQFSIASAAAGAAADKNAPQTRLLTGEVMDKGEAPVPNAVVYLKNIKTLAVKTFITDTNGQYRFPALAPNVDYEIYAEHNGKKSDTKTLSSFDTRPKAIINLKISQ